MPKLNLDDWQKEFLATKGDKILCTGRQTGKSTTCAKDAGDWALSNPNSNILMIAPTERQAYGLFRKTLNYLNSNYPEKISTGRDKPTKEKICLTNGVEIYCLPVGLEGLGIRFLTVHRLYMDECSRIPDDVMDAVTPSLLTTGGDIIMLSTPFGKQGEFYRCWINQEHAYDSFSRFSVSSESTIRKREICETWTEKQRDKALEKIAQARLRMSAMSFAQEYEGDFVDSCFRLFPESVLKKSMVLKRRPVTKGKLYMGCDIARLGGDEITYEVIKKIDERHYEHVENIVQKRQYLTETYDEIVKLQETWKFRKIGIDAGSGSLGVALLDFLLKEPKTMSKVVPLTNQKMVLDEEGHRTARLYKEDMYLNLLSMLEKGELLLLNEQNVLDSLRSVIYEYKEDKENPGKEVKIKISSTQGHIAEGLIRAAILAKQSKDLNLFVTSSNDVADIF
jgi:hypothetical protein